ncbi:Utrophin-like [Homarus americanus]|uniref:Utrophin-like n=1 Tax=Homarus americanus TaxID=6706 RepID=A0A8J5JDG1_HOMAM|nr:Utrophin-like [Homarus americanus]
MEVLLKDEREDVQKKTFAKWINSQLVKGQHPPVTDLFYDLRDGTRLLALLEVLTNKTYKREKGRMRVHHLNNVSRALNILEEHSVKLVNISNEHIVDGSAKLTLGLVWAIILHWQVQGVLKDVMSDLQQTNLEKTLLAWCRQTTKGYHGVDVRNFTTSWTDGLAFNALIHSQRPQLFDWTVLARKHPYARLENAFRLANEQLNIERLLDPEDVNSQVPDKKSIMMYVMCLFQALPHESFTMESLDVSLQSDSSFNIEGSSDDPLRAAAKARPLSTVSIGLSEYQRTLEEVLTWLLGAEDRLAAMPPIADTTEAVKDQFHDLEELMLELTSKQGGIGDVLGEGSRLMREGVMEEEEEEEVRVQMKLLNTRWEDLRVKAMDRQSRLHEKLMSLQQKQLESLKKWLTETEDRIANMSQTLSVHWEHFEQEIEKLRQWLNEKETSLRQFESDPSTEQEHILRHASMLQVLQAEMEVQHRRHAHLQEESGKVLSYIPEGSPAHENISTDIESIQDRMDCLLSIIEAQTQRLAASGIDITKVMVPVDGSSDVVSSSTTTISHEGATVITKIITTKVTETKLEGGSQEDFSVALHQLGGWMDSVEAQIKPKAIEDLSLDQLVQLSQQLESEMDGQKEEYYKVVSLGQSAISETSTIGESSQESERQVAIVSSRWEALMEMLVEIRTRITYLNQKKRVTTDLSDLEVHYQGFVRWFEDVRTVSENEPNAVTLQAEQCKTKIAAMESHNEDIAALKASTKTLNQKWEEESQPLVQQITAFHTKWENLMQRFLEWNETLGEMQAQAVTPTVAPLAPPPESLLKAMDASGKWLESLEAALASEYSASTLPQMQDQHIKFKDLSQKVEMERGNMAHINETCNRLSQDGHVNIMEDITKLNKQWETTTESLRLRIQNIEKVMEKQKQYNDEVSGLKSWLDEVDVFLQAEEAALGDIETLEAQLEQSNALQDDVATLQTNVSNIKTTGKHLIEEGDSELKSIIENQLDELTNRWNLVTELARAQNKSLKEALTRSQKVHDGIDKLNLWLDELEAKIPSSLPRNTPQELSHAVEIFTQLREDISLHSDELRAINNIGDELLQVDSSATHEELARRFTQLNGRWTEVVSQVDSSYKVNITASQQYEDFKKVCSEESEWLDQLQAKLERSSKDAADAEEISEALDELEIFLHSHDERRLEQIRNLAESLVSESCVAEPVQETTHSLTCRFDTLNAQASEQQSGLEGSVQEAQAWEREYVSVLDYLAQSDLILTQAINDEIQVDQVQVEAEMMTQQNVLQKMQAQVEVYHGQGKTEAALRLEDQVSHLQKKYEEIELKLRACQKPSDFDTRLNQVNYQLTGISQQVHLVSVDSGNPDGIQEQLNQCMDLYQTLSEVKAEVESVIATGRKIVKEGQSADPDGLTLQLDQLKALYNKLGGTVTEHRGILERALRHSRKIQKDSSHLEEWLSTTECELDQREATVPTKNVEGEVHFAQHAIDDLGRKKPLLTGLHESYAALTSMSDDPALLQPIKEQVDDITLTWERVSIRLANRLKNMQTEQVAKEAEMERFIIGLGEVKGWLESTEYQLLNISRLDPSDQDQLIKHCHMDTQGTGISSVGFLLTSEAQGSQLSAVHTNTTSTLSTITASVSETSNTTSLTHDSSQHNQTTGINPVFSKSQVPATQQCPELEAGQFPLQDDPTVMETEVDTCENSIQEGKVVLRSTGLVHSIMTTTSTVTTTTSKLISAENVGATEVVSSGKVNLCAEKSQSQIMAQDEEMNNEAETAEDAEVPEMYSSADSNTWGDSSLIDSVVRVEPKGPSSPGEDEHAVNLITTTANEEVNHPSTEKEEYMDEKNIGHLSFDREIVEESANTTMKDQPKKLSLVEVEEVKMTISHLSFNIPGKTTERKILSLRETDMMSCSAVGDTSIEFSSEDVSPIAEFPSDSVNLSDLALSDSPTKDRKRKITETESDLDNFDELIAGLKEVAEKDIDLTGIEGSRRQATVKDVELQQSGDERFSLVKIRRCDDDDLESLASIDTDMAPASEASRDFEGTFSDLESVSESVSSKGDSLFSPNQGAGSLDCSRTEEVRTVEYISQQSQIVSSEAVSHTYIKTSHELISPTKKEIDSNNIINFTASEVLSYDEQIDDGKDDTELLKQEETNQPEQSSGEVTSHPMDYEQLPVEKLQAMIAELEEVMSDAEISDTEDEVEMAEKENVSIPVDELNTFETNQSYETKSTEDEVMTPVVVNVTKQSKISNEDTEEKALPIEFTVQEVHVAGDIEFAKAKSSVEKREPVAIETPRIVVTTPSLHEDMVQNVPNILPEQQQGVTQVTTSQNSYTTVQKVSVQSSQVVHGMTLVTSTEDRLPEQEEAVLVTLISRPSSVEALTTDSESTGNKVIMEEVEVNCDPDMKSSFREEKKDAKEIVEETEPSSVKFSSGDSSEDEESSKERRPTVVECSNISVSLVEENAEEIKKVTSACEIDSSSLDSVTRSSTGQTSVFPTVSHVSSDHVSTCQYSVESTKNLQTYGNSGAFSDSVPAVTHIASGLTSSMLDFFARHSVVIVDPEAEGSKTLNQQAIGPSGVHKTDVNINRGVDAMGISTFEEPVQTPSPFTCPSSEILQGRSAVVSTVEEFSVSVTSASSLMSKETSTSDHQHIALNDDQLRNVNEAQTQIAIDNSNSETERRISTASIGNEAIPTEMTMELVHESIPTDFKNIVRGPFEVNTRTTTEVVVTHPPNVLYKDREDSMESREEINTQNAVFQNNEHVQSRNSDPGETSEESSIVACHTEVIHAADVESGSLIEITYQVEEPNEKNQSVLVLPSVTGLHKICEDNENDNKDLIEQSDVSLTPAYHGVNEDTFVDFTDREILSSHKGRKSSTESQSFVFSPQEVISSIATLPESTEPFLSSQVVPGTVGEISIVSGVTGRAVGTEKSTPESLEQEDFHRKISTASVEIDLAPREVAAAFDTPSPLTGSFVFERQTSVTLQDQCTDSLITSRMVQLIDSRVCSETSDPSISVEAQSRKISTASMEMEFNCDEVAGMLETSSLPTQSFAGEKQTFAAASHCFTDQVVTSEIVLLSASSEKEMVSIDRKISTASREYDFTPQEIVSAIPSPFLQAESFTFPKETSASLEENLETGAVLAEVVQIKDSGCGAEIMKENLETSAVISSTSSTTITDKTERKISTATRDIEIMPVEVTEAIGSEGVSTTSFALERSVSERAMECLNEAILIAPETVLQGSPYRDENASTVEKEKFYSNGYFELIKRKISTASMELELDCSEMLLEETETLLPERFACTSEVLVSASEGCSEDVLLTTVNTIISGTETDELSIPEVPGQVSADIEVISEISEEGIPLGCEAALIDPSVISGFEIKSQSGEGSDFGEIMGDDISFIRGIKSAMPAGYTFTTNTAEDDCMSEALSYYDIETSVDVQDRYGVAVTVIGTRNDLNLSLEDTEEKQIPLEEGGLEELKMETSVDSLLRSSRHSSRGASLDNLLADVDCKDTKESQKDFGVADDLGSRSTFLTEIVNFTDKGYSETVFQKSHTSTVKTISQANNKQTQQTHENSEAPKSVSTRTFYDGDTGISIITQSSKQVEQVKIDEDIEKPFESIKQSRKLDIDVDKLQNISQTNVKKVEGVDIKVKKIEASFESGLDGNTKLQYIPFSPQGIKYGCHVKKDNDNGDASKVKLAEEIVIQDTMTKVQHTPQAPATKLENQILNLASHVSSLATKEQEIKCEEHFEPHVETAANLSIHQAANLSPDVLQKKDEREDEEFKTASKSPIKSAEANMCYVPHVPIHLSTDLQQYKDPRTLRHLDNIQYIPHVPSDGSHVIPQEMKSGTKDEVSTSVIKQSTELMSTVHTEADVSMKKDIKTKIQYVPHAPSSILKKIPEENLSELLGDDLSGEEQSTFTTPVYPDDGKVTGKEEKSKETIRKEDKSVIIVDTQSKKIIEMELTKKESSITKQRDKKSKIEYVPHVPVPIVMSLATPALSQPQDKTEEKLTFKERDFSSIKETDITSDEDEKDVNAPPKKMEIQSKKVKDTKVQYVPHVPQKASLKKEIPEKESRSEGISTSHSEEKNVSIEESILSKPACQKAKGTIEAQIHVPATENMGTVTGTKKESYVLNKQNKESFEIHYTPFVTSDVPKSGLGARPKEIHYVPHSPADLENFKCEEINVKPHAVPSVIITSPSTSKLDAVVASSSDISKNLVKSEDFEDTLSNVSQSEDDDTSSFEIGPELSDTEASNHESFEDMRRLETEDVSVREMGEEAELGSGSPDIDIGMKKRKRFAKLYEETDCEMLNEIKKTEQPLMQDVQAGEESLPEEVSRNPKSKKRALKSTSIVTADSLGKALRRKGLTTDTVEGKTWESSSSSSRSRSNRGSSSEGSIDFGSETRGAISGDWDDAPIPQDLSVQHPVADDQQAQKESLEKVQAHEMLNKVQEHEMLRFSFLSSSSIEMDNEEVFAREIEMESHEVDAMIEVTEIDSSSSDESDDLEEPSNVRISAATIYEHAVINALEGSGEKVSEKRVNQEDSFVGSSETDVTDSTVVQHIVTKEEQGADGKTETYTLILDHKLSSTETAKPCAAILGEHPSLETKQIEMNKIEIEEVTDIYSADQFPNQEINEVIPESVIVTQCKDESNVSLKTADERNTACESPMEELGETVVEVVSKQFPEEEDVQTMTKMICTSLTREDIRESPNQVICSNQSYDITVSQEHKMKENISETAQSGGENQLMTLEQELKKSPDIPLIELHSPVEPQYSTRIREEMEVFETTMESPASPSITINLVSVEVGEETLEVANMSEILTGECEEYKVVEGEQSVTCKDNDDSKYSQASVVSLDNNQSLGKAGLCESVPYLEKAEDENMEKIFEKENLGVKEGVSKKDSKRDEDEEPEVREITRKISVSSSSSSGSSFEMVEHEPEADLEEQLSSHDSYEEMDSGEKDSVTENDMEVDEGMDTIDEPDRVEEQLDPDIASVSLEVKLERHVSIDSSVSTLSEAETVIHVPIGSLSKKISETVSVKDDSQIGVKTLKSVEAQESLMRSVSEELITKTTIPEGKSQGKELSEGIPKISGAKKESGLAPIMQNVDTTIKKVDHESAVLTARLDRHSPAHGGFCKSACEASFVVMMQDDVKDDEAAKCDVIVVENTNKHPGCRVVKAGDLKKESDLRYQRETLREADVLPKTIRKEVESKTSAESSIKKEPVTGSAGAGDAVLGVNFKGEDGWTEVKIIKSSVEETPRMERRVSVDVAQVIEATEVIEEQEVTISIPDVHHGDSRDESSAASDEEMDHIYIKPSEKIFVNLLPDSGEKIEATESKDKIFLPLSSIHLEKHTTVNTEKDEVLSGMPKTSGTCSETKKSLTVSVVCDNAVDIDTKTAETSSKIEIKEVMKSMYDPDKSVCENIEVNKNRGQSQLGKEVPSYTQYELKDIGFVVIDDYSASKSGEPKEETEKESPLSSAASNSNSSSPYYDASGEMVESLGSDDVSTSMEVLHSSAEILDTPADCWSSPNDQPTQSAEEIISLESKDKSVPLRDTKCYLTPGSEHRSSRFSTISVLTDASEGEVIFSETEGEEYPYEDTTDDDLTLEEEAIKTMAEVRLVKSQGLIKNFSALLGNW